MKFTKYYQNLILSTPLLILVLIGFIWGAEFLNISLNPKLVALGAFGWWVALLLRFPVMLVSRKMDPAKAQRLIIFVSGPAEEITRLSILLLVGLTVQNAYAIGIGWAAIEIIYSLIQGIGMGVLQNSSDPKAEEGKALLRTMGMDKTFEPTAPYWGVIERISATAIHLALSLILTVSPYFIVLTTTLHSFTNYLLIRLVKKSIAKAELILFLLSTALLLGAVVVIG